jgi:hypothetical protein
MLLLLQHDLTAVLREQAAERSENTANSSDSEVKISILWVGFADRKPLQVASAMLCRKCRRCRRRRSDN